MTKVKGRKNPDGTYTIFYEGLEFPAKRCTVCDEVRFLKYFKKDSNRPDGHRNICKKCVNDAQSLRDMYNYEPHYKEIGEI